MDPNSQRKPRRRRRRKSHSSAAQSGTTTTIASLSDDNLADILLRLPSPASLGRAALACPRWLRLATSRDFLRRFRALHPRPPLLGCFICSAELPVFHRVRDLKDPDLAAATRGGDFLFTSFIDGSGWRLKDCRDGLFLFASDNLNELALFDPVSRRRIRIPFPPHDTYSRDERVCCLLPSSCGGATVDVAPSFSVVSLEHDWEERLSVRAHVFISRTSEWRSHQWAPPPYKDLDLRWLSPAMHAAGRIYWKQEDGNINFSVLLSLNTETMELSRFELPSVPDFSSAIDSPPGRPAGVALR